MNTVSITIFKTPDLMGTQLRVYTRSTHRPSTLPHRSCKKEMCDFIFSRYHNCQWQIQKQKGKKQDWLSSTKSFDGAPMLIYFEKTQECKNCEASHCTIYRMINEENWILILKIPSKYVICMYRNTTRKPLSTNTFHYNSNAWSKGEGDEKTLTSLKWWRTSKVTCHLVWRSIAHSWWWKWGGNKNRGHSC
jgi:hypothetical protein